jgi:fatty acid desaturase
MSGETLRSRHVRKFVGLRKYTHVEAWMVVTWYVLLIGLSVVAGHYLISLTSGFTQAIGVFLLTVFIGTRLRGINNIVHECSHATFCQDRKGNVLIGKFCSAFLSGCFEKYKADHLSHHSHLGDYELDREMEPIENLGLHDPLTLKSVGRHLLTPLLGRHLKVYSGTDLSADDGPFFFGLKIALLIGLAGFTFVNPLVAFWFLIFPLFYVFPTINFWTDCLDHAGLIGETDELRASRNILAPNVLRLLFFPRNDCYHLVHHLFPHIPARHLMDAHKTLADDTDYGTEELAMKPLGAGLVRSRFNAASTTVRRLVNRSDAARAGS